eukprot:TRINITY_DN26326_c0_g1_i6.p1 TRINITY_DN26326_c0_g1~~TRINITY_DN26326_c0_g1_i6.p1  ORF type:complete len:686 (+),score=118.00 TRINITY_DN26326_c0_g1_i6:71-2128(+)
MVIRDADFRKTSSLTGAERNARMQRTSSTASLFASSVNTRPRRNSYISEPNISSPDEKHEMDPGMEMRASVSIVERMRSMQSMRNVSWRRLCNHLEEVFLGGRRKRHRHSAFTQNEEQPLRKRVHDALKNHTMKAIAAVMVAINSILIVVEADFEVRYGKVPAWIGASSFFFMVYFCVELLAKTFVYRLRFLEDRVNALDVVVVLIDIIGVVLEASIGDLPSFSSLRALRFLRVTRILKEFCAFRELYLMIAGLISAVRAIFFGSALIFLVLAMWAVFAVQVLHPMCMSMLEDETFDCERCMYAYNSVPRAMVTFTQLTVVADSWDLYARPLLQYHPQSAFIIIPAYICVQLGLVNVIAAVIVDRQASAREDDSSLQHIHHLEELDASFVRLASIFDRADQDGSGVLDQAEIVEAFDQDVNFRQMLEVLDITRDDMATVFDILDRDGSGTVNYIEFVEKLHYIRLINPHTLMVFMKHRTEALLVDTQDMVELNQSMVMDVAKKTELMRVNLEHSIQHLHQVVVDNLRQLGCDARLEIPAPQRQVSHKDSEDLVACMSSAMSAQASVRRKQRHPASAKDRGCTLHNMSTTSTPRSCVEDKIAARELAEVLQHAAHKDLEPEEVRDLQMALRKERHLHSKELERGASKELAGVTDDGAAWVVEDGRADTLADIPPTGPLTARTVCGS